MHSGAVISAKSQQASYFRKMARRQQTWSDSGNDEPRVEPLCRLRSCRGLGRSHGPPHKAARQANVKRSGRLEHRPRAMTSLARSPTIESLATSARKPSPTRGKQQVANGYSVTQSAMSRSSRRHKEARTMSRSELAKFTKNDLLCCTQSLELTLLTLIAGMKIKERMLP